MARPTKNTPKTEAKKNNGATLGFEARLFQALIKCAAAWTPANISTWRWG